jgi:hypothetical protein
VGQRLLDAIAIRYKEVPTDGVGNDVENALDVTRIDRGGVVRLEAAPHLQNKIDDRVIVFVFG